MIEEREFYWKMLDALDEGIYFTDKDRKITYWNKAAEAITGYSGGEVLSKHCRDNILVHVDTEGRNLCDAGCPLAGALEKGQTNEQSVFLLNKQGRRVAVRIRTTPIRDETGEIIGAVQVFTNPSAREKLAQRLEALEEKGLLDRFTGIPNRKYLEIRLEAGLNELQRYRWPLGILYIRLALPDKLKESGREDRCRQLLRTAADSLLGNLTPFDLLGRWHDEEFVVILYNTSPSQLKKNVDLYRMLLEKTDFSACGSAEEISLHLGFTMGTPEDTPAACVERAKKAAH